ncbi:MAG: hypothetical protein JXA94_03735 [Parachlamydiales bacterium]|nr:hypothetical protein [Parachlamydiales bacterium]
MALPIPGIRQVFSTDADSSSPHSSVREERSQYTESYDTDDVFGLPISTRRLMDTRFPQLPVEKKQHFPNSFITSLSGRVTPCRPPTCYAHVHARPTYSSGLAIVGKRIIPKPK